MTPQKRTFHEGQEVEVKLNLNENGDNYRWREAKIVGRATPQHVKQSYYVKFYDGGRGVFDSGNIRVIGRVKKELKS